MLHFDKTPVDNTQGVRENPASFGFRRVAHPLHRSDLAPCDLSLFGAMKQAIAWQYFATIDELLMSVKALVRGLSADFLQTVFQEWMRRLKLRCEGGGEYAERTLQNGTFTFVIARMGDESPGQD
jgi:hypothetical protein